MNNFHQEMFGGNQVNRDYVNSQINKQTNYIMNQRNNNELFSHRTPPLLLMNNNKSQIKDLIIHSILKCQE